MIVNKAFLRVTGGKFTVCEKKDSEGWAYFPETSSLWVPCALIGKRSDISGFHAQYDILNVGTFTTEERELIIRGIPNKWFHTLIETAQAYWRPLISKEYANRIYGIIPSMTPREKRSLLKDLGQPPKFHERAYYFLFVCCSVTEWRNKGYTIEQAAADMRKKGFTKVTRDSLAKDISRGKIPSLTKDLDF